MAGGSGRRVAVAAVQPHPLSVVSGRAWKPNGLSCSSEGDAAVRSHPHSSSNCLPLVPSQNQPHLPPGSPLLC